MKGDGIPLTPACGPLPPRKDLFDGGTTAAGGVAPAIVPLDLPAPEDCIYYQALATYTGDACRTLRPAKLRSSGSFKTPSWKAECRPRVRKSRALWASSRRMRPKNICAP